MSRNYDTKITLVARKIGLSFKCKKGVYCNCFGFMYVKGVPFQYNLVHFKKGVGVEAPGGSSLNETPESFLMGYDRVTLGCVRFQTLFWNRNTYMYSDKNL